MEAIDLPGIQIVSSDPLKHIDDEPRSPFAKTTIGAAICPAAW
jgi:hypothetical protein